jgi:5-methylcytosine-specific restriction protein A
VKRSSELRRLTPLTLRAELKRSTFVPRSALHADPAGRRQPRRAPSSVPPKVRAALKLRSGGLCEIEAPGCTEIATDFSHRKKVGAGGRKGAAAVAHHVLSNGLAACRSCHQFCHANPAASYAAGWMLREDQNPLSEPVVYRGTWCLLDDSCSVYPIELLEEEPVPNYVQEVIRDLSGRLPNCPTDLLALYALLVKTRGPETTLEDVHDAWSIWCNGGDPEHRSLIPFGDLSVDVQELDRKYMTAIHEAAKAVA